MKVHGVKGRSLVELIISWALIFIIAGTFAGYAGTILTKAKQAVLKNELKNIRLAIILYYILNKRYPADLKMLIDRDYQISPHRGPLLKGVFLNNLKYDGEGRLKDPFGNFYLYNPNTGVIKSQTKRYRDW